MARQHDPQERKERPVATRPPLYAAAVMAAATLLLTGCGNLSSDDVAATARSFAGAEDDPATRCSLLSDQALSALVENEGATCEDALQDLPVGSGDVVSVQVW